MGGGRGRGESGVALDGGWGGRTGVRVGVDAGDEGSTFADRRSTSQSSRQTEGLTFGTE